MKKHLYAALMLLIVLVGCQKEDARKMASSSTKVTIAQSGHDVLYMPLYVAKNKGFFSAQGLDVDLINTGSDEKALLALSSGSVQFAVADPVLSALDRKKGRLSKVIATVVNGVPFWGVTNRRDIDSIDEVRQFSGMRIAASPPPSASFTVMAETLKQAGLTEKTQLLPVEPDNMFALLKDQKADIAMEPEPMASIAAKTGGHIVYFAARHFGDFAYTGLITSEENLEQNAAQAQSVVLALAKAIAWIHADFEDALVMAHAEFPDIPEDVMQDSLHHIIHDKVMPYSVVITETAWNNAVRLHRSTDEAVGDALFSENVDMQYAQRAP